MPMFVAGLRDSSGSYGPGFLVLVALAAVGAIAVSLLHGRRQEESTQVAGGPGTKTAARLEAR